MHLIVEPTRLSELSSVLSDAATTIRESLQQLGKDSSALTGAWEGEAKLAYQALYDSFAGDAVDWVDALTVTADVVKTLGTDCATADDKGAKAIPH